MPTVIVPIAAAGDDYEVLSNYDVLQTSYPPGAYAVSNGTNVRPLKSYNTGANHYEVYTPLLRFDTGSSIPDDATVTVATLRLYCYQKANTDSLSVRAEWYSWSTPPTTADWTYQNGNNAHSGTAISSIALTANADYTLANLSNISLTGYTGIRLGLSGVGGNMATAPTGDNYAFFRDIENDATNKPQLTITYTLPAVRLAPDNIVLRTNLPNVDGVVANDATALAAIDEDPDSGGTDWLTV